MATKKKLLQAAAGAAGGEALNVEDVFSTYLYEGNGSTQTIENGIALGNFGLGTSTEFNGTSDYLSRSSDLASNADGKTFTFSAWVYHDTTGGDIITFGASNQFIVYTNNERVSMLAKNSSGTYILNAETSTGQLGVQRWNHILISIDLANTSNRYVYINDVDKTSTVTWSTYTNNDIDFTQTAIKLCGNSTYLDGRIAHVYLDYTYRDLSNSTNRRLFIDANGGSTSPSTLSALSPILYLPMTDGYTVGENLGTGGDFTVNGSPTIIQSGTEYQADYGEGGLVWLKERTALYTDGHWWEDTLRGVNKVIKSNSTAAEGTINNSVTAFNSNGFSIGANASFSSTEMASWTFRKAPKFFDVVTYTGNGTAGHTISHNLGSVPGCIIIKELNNTSDWIVYHRGIDVNGDNAPETDYINLNKTSAAADGDFMWNDTAPTATDFTLGYASSTNQSGYNFVAYLFAHNDGDGEFGPTGDQDIIKCGSYTGNGSTDGPEIDLGFEPQWVLIKKATGISHWFLADTMRGWTAYDGSSQNMQRLFPNLSNAESLFFKISPTASGFKVNETSTDVNDSGDTYIYIAIRRGPMAVPESATDVFAMDTGANSTPSFNAGFSVDAALVGRVDSTDKWFFTPRLTGSNYLNTASTSAESSSPAFGGWDYQTQYYGGNLPSTYQAWMWKRAPSFFDVVAYTGNGTAGRTVSHNLGVAPEMMWVKRRDGSKDWFVYHSDVGAAYSLKLNLTNASGFSGAWDSTAPSDTSFTVGNGTESNYSNYTYIAYLFASLDGVSKVGSFSHTNGTDTNVDCGFSSGARFVLLKRYDDASNWYVYDSERGIVSGNDPLLYLNLTNAESTSSDLIDPYSAGFTFSSVVSTGDWIFYAIA